LGDDARGQVLKIIIYVAHQQHMTVCFSGGLAGRLNYRD